jgi:voltage-gated potassium channel
MRRGLERVVGPVPNIRWLVFGLTAVTILCAIVARWIAEVDFPTIGIALWWSVQTVTTVGYGDVTPKTTEGRAVAAILMVSAIAFISILTATISAGFVRRQQLRRGQEDPVIVALTRIESRLAALEEAIGQTTDTSGARSGSNA